MNSTFELLSWNVKGIKTREKQEKLWECMKRRKSTSCWCIQEHHLDASTPRKQTLGEFLFFYGSGPDGFSGVMTAVHRDLEPKVVLQHPSGRALAISVKVHKSILTIVNIYAPNDSKNRKLLWKDLSQINIEGEFCLVGDFHMVYSRQDRQGPANILAGGERN